MNNPWTPIQVPVLCKHCGGMAELGEGFELKCPFCGTEDRLPQDLLDRALELRARVAHAARAKAQLRGLDSALVGFYETRHGLTLTRLGLVLLVGWALYKVVFEMRGLGRPEGFGPTAYVLILIFPFAGTIAAPLGLVVGMAIGRWRYRTTLRPHLFANPPVPGGLLSRCRACLAELPETRRPVTRCLFCGTLSLLREEHHHKALRRALVDESRTRAQTRRTLAKAQVSGMKLARDWTVAWLGATAVISALLLIAFYQGL